MGYFPNGSAGDDYRESYCYSCMNWKDDGDGRGEGCPVQDLHMLWNYEACRGKEAPKESDKNAKYEALEHFIPHTKNGLGCEQCKMFIPKTGHEVIIDKTDALKEWEALYGKRAE